MFERSVDIYDAIYSFKDYAAETARVDELIKERCPGARSLLDVACGTGHHIELLRKLGYECAGMDLDREMLRVARERNPEVPFHEGDMASFDLGRTFDAVTCLFSSIGYVKTMDRLAAAVARMAAHLAPGGVLIVEPWFGPDDWIDGHLGANFVDLPDLKVARMNVARSEGRISIVDFEYLVARPDGVKHFTELHELGMFTHDELVDAFRGAGLELDHDPYGLMGRGLFIGVGPR